MKFMNKQKGKSYSMSFSKILLKRDYSTILQLSLKKKYIYYNVDKYKINNNNNTLKNDDKIHRK